MNRSVFTRLAIISIVALLLALSPHSKISAGTVAPTAYQGQWTGMPTCDHVYRSDDGLHGRAIPSPNGVATDSLGNLYVADCGIDRVLRITPKGVVTTVAGNGKIGHSRDGVLATSTSLTYPFKVAVDGVGNVYILESNDNIVLRVDTNGIVTTVAGNGDAGYGGDRGPAINAMLKAPFGLAVQASGVIYIADAGNNRIRKVDLDGIITTVAGDGQYGDGGDGGAAIKAQLFGPMGISVDSKGILYIADTHNHRIRKIDARGVITTFAGTGLGSGALEGPALLTSLHSPQAVAVDDNGGVFIADSGHGRICRADAQGHVWSLTKLTSAVAHSREDLRRPNSFPLQVAIDNQRNMYVAMFDAPQPYIKIGPDGVVSTIALPGTN